MNRNDESPTRVMSHRDQRGSLNGQSVAPGIRILIVVGDRRSGRALARMLTAMGQSDIHAVANATRAIVAAHRLRPGIVFLDVALGPASSYELARNLRRAARQRNLRVIALTERIELSTRDEARAAGFERWLVTPVAQDELDEVLGRTRIDGAPR